MRRTAIVLDVAAHVFVLLGRVPNAACDRSCELRRRYPARPLLSNVRIIVHDRLFSAFASVHIEYVPRPPLDGSSSTNSGPHGGAAIPADGHAWENSGATTDGLNEDTSKARRLCSSPHFSGG